MISMVLIEIWSILENILIKVLKITLGINTKIFSILAHIKNFVIHLHYFGQKSRTFWSKCLKFWSKSRKCRSKFLKFWSKCELGPKSRVNHNAQKFQNISQKYITNIYNSRIGEKDPLKTPNVGGAFCQIFLLLLSKVELVKNNVYYWPKNLAF